MKLGIPKEIIQNETRVALIPQSVKKITSKGIQVLIEQNAGQAAYFFDENYKEAGAEIVKSPMELFASADLVMKINKPEFNEKADEYEINMMKEGSCLVSLLQPATNVDGIQRLVSRKISAFSLDSIPRITRAQSMDVLSAMSTIAGYKAVLIAAANLPKFFPMFMTAAGTIAPAKVFVIGAGVAGLQAIATARRLGAVVEAFDTRPVVKEQIESLGARFVSFDLKGEKTEGEGGYAKQLSSDSHKRELEFMAEQIKRFDVVITTAQIPGKRAPVLISEKAVLGMQPGSVIVDLAADMGGNCELTELGKDVIKNGVKICGPINLPSSMPMHASQMFSKNMESVISLLVKDKLLNLDLNDEIIKGALITHQGVVLKEDIKHLLAKVH
ncbi:MAG: Re/Si-specific NAD(P)(+) transhydrogenase subunit alpha [Candidatus Melainabacteria bacterium]|nr:Re/Si-specific NAD(P)(+) transhydrogenase subunit alpha [Candidatus Melainabacteria bacterium]MBI3307968.1 Re/Si-specific NAD(P)(+) transhydrogenase subunit alpha [Candidatus Melainabacteria bacterium]